MLIRILPDEVKSKIASGEVIEGPAEVVKELVENSLDAGATRIEVEIIKGGKRFIQVKDNGFGIPSEDIEKAILGGATSKITSLEDLQRLHTYGFRGEALHAISTVSRMIIRSRFYQESSGREIRVEGGKIMGIREIGMPVGTHIEVYDLFYNLPVRRNFLPRENVESRRVYKIVKNLALANPSVTFYLKADGKDVLHLRPVEDLRDRLENLFEKAFEHITMEDPPFKVDIFLSLEKATGTYFIVNKRPVYNKEIIEFLKKITGNLCVCYVWTPPYMVDVNIHPKKTEIRIFKENRLKELIKTALNRIHKPSFVIKQKVNKYTAEMELIGIVDETIIVAKYGDYLYFFDQHLLSERYNHEVMKKPVEESCRTAIKAGEKVDPKKAKELLKSWLSFENKETCPHGRPMYHRIYIGEIYKKLGRNY